MVSVAGALVWVTKCGISMVLVPLFSVTVLVSIEAIVLSTVTVTGSLERITVLLPRFTIFVETTVSTDGAAEVLFWNGAAEDSGTGTMLPDGAKPAEAVALLSKELRIELT